ncbi:MAG: hypothetical protein ACLFQL_10280 [Paracoccaceae bacterium]
MQPAGVRGLGRRELHRLLATLAEPLAWGGGRPVSPDAGSGRCDGDLWLLPDGPIGRITQDLVLALPLAEGMRAPLAELAGHIRLENELRPVQFARNFRTSTAFRCHTLMEWE